MPGLVMNVRKAQVSLEIVVIGGSIAGLASAYALRRGGHKVVVLERTDGRARGCGGIRAPPNMTRVLNHWGLQSSMAKYALKCSAFNFLNGETGEDIGRITLHEQSFQDLLADFCLVQHGDLHSHLLEIAIQEGVEIRYNSEVTCLTDTGAVVLANDELIEPNLIVGADGQTSLTRKYLSSKEVPEEVPSDQLTLLFSIPTERMRDDEDLRHLISTDLKIWLGDSYVCQGHLSHGSEEYSLLLSYSIDDDLSEYRENWTRRYSVEHFDLDYDRFELSLRKLLQMAEYTIPTSYATRPLLESLVCDDGRLVLVGEAAHPLVPGGVQPTAMCLEDAEILGNLLSRLQSKEDLPRFLSAYEELRLPRCREADGYETRNRTVFTLPKGPAQKMRDAKLRWGTAEWDQLSEDKFWEVWGDEVKFYPFDASEKADDWWVKWGALLLRQNSRNGENLLTPPTPTVEVSISNH